MQSWRSTRAHSFAEIYPAIEPYSLLQGTAPAAYAKHWVTANAVSFLAKAPVPVERTSVPLTDVLTIIATNHAQAASA